MAACVESCLGIWQLEEKDEDEICCYVGVTRGGSRGGKREGRATAISRHAMDRGSQLLLAVVLALPRFFHLHPTLLFSASRKLLLAPFPRAIKYGHKMGRMKVVRKKVCTEQDSESKQNNFVRVFQEPSKVCMCS